MLKKMSNSIACHAIRDVVAIGEILIAWNHTDENVADVMTKALPGGELKDNLKQAMFWAIN
jgi:hypothetical protein